MPLLLFPNPARAVFTGRAAVAPAACRWLRVDPAFSPRLCRRARELTGRRATTGTPDGGRLLLDVAAVAGMPREAYRLSCTADGARLEATDEAGAFYGLATFAQLLEQAEPCLPECTLEDAPDFPVRGVMLDISRCKVPTLATLKRLLGLLAGFKINQVQLYMEHTFAFSAHPAVWRDASPLTAAEVRELDDWCHEHYLELVPNFNSFGHFERWLKHPEYRHLAECPNGITMPWGEWLPGGSTLRPDDASLALLESLFDELLPNFRSSLFNVGGDETWDLGQGRSRDLCAARGKTRVYLDFLLQLHRHVTARGRRMMFWGDIILQQPELVGELPRDLTALAWGYEADHPFAEQGQRFAAAGVPFYVCPGTSSWNAITGRTANCLANLAAAAQHGRENGAAGCLITDWGDFGHHQCLPISWTGFAAGAAYAWNLRTNRDADIAAALDRWVYRDPAGVLGQAFLDLGRAHDPVSGAPFNATIFHQLLFWDMKQELPWLATTTAPMFRDCLARLDELDARIAAARPQGDDHDLVLAEFRHTVAMARHAVHRGLAARDPALPRAPLRDELRQIRQTHEALWLARNRPGGLPESTGYLLKAMAPLEDT